MSTNRPANSGLINAPILPHKFIHPDTVPEKLRPKSVAAAQLIPIEIPIPPRPSDNQKILTYKFPVRTAKIIETANTINPAIAMTPLATNLNVLILIHGQKLHLLIRLRRTLITKVMN